MNNEQLIQRVQDNLPEDLSCEEIELLRERMRQSPELRDVLAGHLYWEQFLNTGLARDTLSAEQVVARFRARRLASRARLWRWVGWPLLLLAGAAAVGFSIQAWNRAQVEPPVVVADAPEAHPAASARPASDDHPAPVAQPAAAPTEATAQNAQIDPLAQFSTDKPRPFRETCFEPLAPVETPAELARVQAFWRPLGGSLALGRGRQNAAGVAVSGKFELRTAWPPGQVLRLSLIDGDRMTFDFAAGVDKVSLQFTDRPTPVWAAYCSRTPSQPGAPESELLAAADGDRYRRTAGGPIELRCQDGLVVLSRGDVLLLAAPLAGQPERIDFEVPGHALLGNLAFAPGEPFPLAAPNRPGQGQATDAKKTPQPAAAAFHGELPAGIAQTVGDDGACELSAHDNLKPGWVSLNLDQPGTRELLFRIDAASPGTGIVLLDDDDRPRDGIGFNAIRRTQQLVVGYARPTDRVSEVRENQKGPAPLVGVPLWLRIIAGPSLKCWTSADGVHWALALEGHACEGRWKRIGLYCAAGKGQRSIRVSQFTMHRLPALAALADTRAGPEL
ncbi:MAG TPA: hypothetical protein VHY20_03970, partial [Pirellulales bacterium]|nr:hypothetical protein [Pirellulales bacterium]